MGHSGCGEGKGQKVARCITNFYRQRLKHEVVQSLVLELGLVGPAYQGQYCRWFLFVVNNKHVQEKGQQS